MTPFAAVGPKLVERGYSAIPILPGSKRPGYGRTGLTDWERFGTRLPTEIEIAHWSGQEAGVGVVGGGPHDLVAIDLDTDVQAVVTAVLSILPASPVRKAGAKGFTLFYRGPGVASQSFNLDGRRVVDVIGPGRQTVVPPSLHPSGQPYVWTGERALETVDPDDLPELPADVGDRIAAALAPLGWHPEPVRPPVSQDADSPHRALNETALANLPAWVPQLGLYKCRPARGGYEAVATWRASGTGQAIEKRKRNLKVHPSGIRDMGAPGPGLSALDLVMVALGVPLDEAFANLSGWLGLSPAVAVDLAPSSPPAPIPDVALKREPPSNDLTRPPGLLGEMTDWIAATARRPNRMLALGAAITVLGTLVGRRLAGPTRSGTHLYVLGLAPTGAGKDHPLTQVTRLMKAAKAGHHVGPDELISMPAAINLILRSPLCVCPMDEFGAFLRRINHRRASGFEQGITKILRSAWGKSFSTLHTPEWAGKTARAIEAPALSIFGVSTPEEFYGALEGGDVVNGVLNRFLVLRSSEKVRDRDPELDPYQVPEWLADALQQVYGENPLVTARLNDIALDAPPEILGWADDGAKAVYATMLDEIEAAVDRTPVVAPFMARTAEMAARLATIRAVGLGLRSRLVGAGDITWGRDVALLSARAMAGEAADFIADNERHAHANRIVRMIKDRGELRIRDIQATFRGALKSSEIKDIVAGLVEGGHVEQFDATDPKRHTTKVVGYRMALIGA